MKNLMVVGVLVGAFWLNACGSKSESSDSGTVLSGTWTQECTTKVDRIYVYGGSNVTQTADIFEDSTCTTASFKLVRNSNYTIGTDVSGLEGAKKIDYTLVSTKLTPTSATSAGGFTTIKYCGLSTWTINVEVDISGRTCNGITETVGKINYDIFKITDGKTVQFGLNDATKTGEAEATRPTQISSAVTLTKS